MILKNLRQTEKKDPYSFQDRFHKIKRVAIIYPKNQVWLRIARYALQRMYNLPEHFEYLLLIPPNSPTPELKIQHEYSEMNYAPRPAERQELASHIQSFNPDILLQLEPEPGELLVKFISQLDIPLKMGFGDEKSDLNIIYSQSESGFYEKNLLNLIALLEM